MKFCTNGESQVIESNHPSAVVMQLEAKSAQLATCFRAVHTVEHISECLADFASLRERNLLQFKCLITTQKKE